VVEAEVAERVRELAGAYRPPSFGHVPTADAALFLCAIDHKAGYRGRYLVGGRGPYRGSALMWEVALLADRRRRGELLVADRLVAVIPDEVAEVFRIGGETVTGPEVRARLWRDAGLKLQEHPGGSTKGLLAATERRLGGPGGLLARLSDFEAFADPLQKKSFLLAKVLERRGWWEVDDPESWQVAADSVLMRLALRSGLVRPGAPEEVRAATRDAFKRVAELAGLAPPVLDDLLWERGREDPDLLGTAGGDVSEPPRPLETIWY
jgi:hypothetical protein